MLERLASGRKPFGPFGGFGGNPVRVCIDAVRVAGEPPPDSAAWAKVAQLHAWRRDIRSFVARWNAVAAQHDLTVVPAEDAASRDALARLGRHVGAMLALMVDAGSWLKRLPSLFPYGIDARSVVLRLEVNQPIASLRAWADTAGLQAASQLRASLRVAGERIGGMLGDALCDMADGLGTPDASDRQTDDRWRSIREEGDRLVQCIPDMQRLEGVMDLRPV